MDIKNLKGIEIRENYNVESLDTVISKIYAGNTILFIGAGFSLGCTNQSATPIPLSKDLSRQICELGDFEVDDDLAYSADFYLKYNEPSPLIKLLKDSFLINGVSKYHMSIASMNWRRVYTTNYDNCYELAAGKAGKQVRPITLEDSPAKHFKERSICVHINGSIQSLDHNSLENSFKLTESSYTNSDAFSDSSWSYRFKKDLEICSQIVFVGYSLYDMEVKRLLVGSDDIKRKTYFVTNSKISNKEHHRLSSFGEVFPIGVDHFAELIRENEPKQSTVNIEYLSSLKREKINYDPNFEDSDTRNFLLRGILDNDIITASYTSEKIMYAVKRKQTLDILELLNSINIVVVHSSFANGKSVILNQIQSMLLLENKLVYTVRDDEADYEKDIEQLADSDQIIYLLVDDFETKIDLIRYFNSSLGDNGKLILAERPHRYRRAMDAFHELGLKSNNINADFLHQTEVEELSDILNFTGLWGDLGGNSREKQLKFLKTDCESQLSIVLLNLLNAPHVVRRFQSSFREILKHPETKKAIYAACLIQHVYPPACTKSFISDISESNHVYSTEFQNRVNESELFEFKGDSIITRSSVFCTFILSNLYKASYSIDQMVRIVEKLQKSRAYHTFEEKELYRSIMTFSTISSVMPDENRPNSYVQFYERLKAAVPSVIGNPHYWLQYAMAVMSINNLNDAEIILKTAYSKAENSIDYDTTYIDNQFARLNLKKALVENDPNLGFSYFIEAHKILKHEEDDIYKFRQAGLYIHYYQNKYNGLPKGKKVEFEHAVKEITNHFERFLQIEYAYDSIPPYQQDNFDQFTTVISDITGKRKA